VPYISNLLLAIGLRSVKIYWLTTVEMDNTTKVRLITNGKSFSSAKISVTKKPMDCNKDAWHRDDKAAINKKGQTNLSLYEILVMTLSTFSLGKICFGKVRKMPIAAIKPQKAKT